MLANTLFARLRKLKPVPAEIDDTILLDWLNQVEGQILHEIFLIAIPEITPYEQTPTEQLAAPHPYDAIYLHWMMAQVDYYNGEYERYTNTMQRYNTAWNDLARHVARCVQPVYGEAVDHGYYLSAYGIAKAHGYNGTEEQWLASLQGAAGKDGKPFNWRGAWDNTTSYAPLDAVEHNGSSYIWAGDEASTAGDEPGVDELWELCAAAGAAGAPGEDGKPFNWRGAWNETALYSKLDAVSYEGSSYIFASDSPATGAVPGVDEEWQLMAQGGESGGTDISLNMDSATAGQIAKISAVDENGAPTAWEPADMPGGGSAELPEVLGNLGAAMQDAAAGSIPVAAGDAAWALRKLIEAYTGGEGELSGYIPSTAWVNELLSAAAVRYDKAQGISFAQQRTARGNIGAAISAGTYWCHGDHKTDAIGAAGDGELFIWLGGSGSGTGPIEGITAPVLMIPGENSRGTVTISALDATGAWYTGFINLSTAATSLSKLSAPLPVSAAADAGKLLQVGTDGKAKWGDKLPTALKNPAALTFTGAATGTYDGSAALTINIPEGGSGGSSGGGLRKMSAVSGYLGIPVAQLPQDGTIWMCISSGDNAELYSGTITIEGGDLAVNNLIAVSSGSVIQLNQATIVSTGFAIYGMSATNFVGVWQQIGAGGASSGSDISLGLTSATAGQIAKISAVDENGAPTAWEPADMPSGGGSGEKPLSLIASYDFTDNTASGFDETGLNNLTELIFLPTNVTNATTTPSGLTLRINDIDVANALVPTGKSGADTGTQGEPWEVCRYNGVFWECLVCNAKNGAVATATVSSHAILNNSAIRNVGPATKMTLYTPNSVYKPVTGTLEVWGK